MYRKKKGIKPPLKMTFKTYLFILCDSHYLLDFSTIMH